MTDQIDWTDRPPEVPQATVWIPPPGKTWIVQLGALVGVWVHWMGKRSLPCMGKDCPVARHRRPAYWTGYTPCALPIYDQAERSKVIGWRPIVVGFSAANVEQLGNFRGTHGVAIQIDRASGKRGWNVAKHFTPPRDETLPNCFPVRPVLYRLWGVRPACEMRGDTMMTSDGRMALEPAESLNGLAKDIPF